MSEQRRSIRIAPKSRAAQIGKILLGPRALAIDCHVVDLSASGACLELSQMPAFPDRFEFIHGGVRKFCRLVWQRRFRIGIKYEATMQKSMIDGGLSRTTTNFSRLSRPRR